MPDQNDILTHLSALLGLRPWQALHRDLAEPTLNEPLPKMVGVARQDRPFQEAVEQGYSEVPDPVREMMGKLNYKVRAAKELGEIYPDYAGNAGVTFPEKHEIGISGRYNWWVPNTVIHEVGHALSDFPMYPLYAQAPFSDAYNKETPKQPHADDYAATSPGEGFSEMFTMNTQKQHGHKLDYPYDLYEKEYPETAKATQQLTDREIKYILSEFLK